VDVDSSVAWPATVAEPGVDEGSAAAALGPGKEPPPAPARSHPTAVRLDGMPHVPSAAGIGGAEAAPAGTTAPTDPALADPAPSRHTPFHHKPTDPRPPVTGPQAPLAAFPAPIRAGTAADPRTPAGGSENHLAWTLPFPVPIDPAVHRGAEIGTGRATLDDASIAPTVVRPDPVTGRVAPFAAPEPARPDAFDIADRVAALLDEESDLRGLRR
jgi:hypothetical protein